MQTNNALQADNMPYDSGNNFEDAVQALERQLEEGVKSALHEPSYTVDELKRELEL